MAEDGDGGIMHPRAQARVNRNPLQRPGRDHLVRETTLLGPDEPGDRALYLDVKTLQALLGRAREARTGRVRIPRCGIKVQLYERADGRRYEVWMVVGGRPEPEPDPPWVRGLSMGG